jgi:hypothetical protein
MTNMKKRIIISESEKKEILSKHLEFGYKTINEQSVQDIQNKLNKDFGSNIVADNKFGPKTATAIINALDKIKSGAVTPSQSAPVSTANTTNTASTTTQVTNAQGTATPPSTANTATTVNTQVTNNQGETIANNTVKAEPGKTKNEDPADGD